MTHGTIVLVPKIQPFAARGNQQFSKTGETARSVTCPDHKFDKALFVDEDTLKKVTTRAKLGDQTKQITFNPKRKNNQSCLQESRLQVLGDREHGTPLSDFLFFDDNLKAVYEARGHCQNP